MPAFAPVLRTESELESPFEGSPVVDSLLFASPVEEDSGGSVDEGIEDVAMEEVGWSGPKVASAAVLESEKPGLLMPSNLVPSPSLMLNQHLEA